MPEIQMTKEKPRFGEGIYTASDVSAILGISRPSAYRLMKVYFSERLPDQTAYRYNLSEEGTIAVNFMCLIEIQVFRFLRKVKSVREIVRMHNHLSTKYDTPYPFATAKLAVAGRDVIELLDGDQYLEATGTQKLFFEEILKPFLKTIVYDDRGIPKLMYPLGQDDKDIVIDPDIKFGAPTIAGTRVKVETLANMHEAGDSLELLARLYEIPPVKVQKAISYWNRAA